MVVFTVLQADLFFSPYTRVHCIMYFCAYHSLSCLLPPFPPHSFPPSLPHFPSSPPPFPPSSIQDRSKPPHCGALKRILSLGQLVPVNQDLLDELETCYTAAKTWVDRTSHIFLKKNTNGFLLEVQTMFLRLSHGCIVTSFPGLSTVQF